MNNIIDFDVRLQKRNGEDMNNKILKDKMLEIENITKKILENIDLTQSPYVDIVPLVKKEGFIVEPHDMPIDTTGCLFVNDKAEANKKIIMVNTHFKNPDNETDVILKKSRFITAHEYGHFVLHKKEGEPIYAHRDSDHRTDQIELEADYFARSILMPIKQFKLYYNVLNDFGNHDNNFTIEMLSELFKVTQNKIQKRMEDLLVLN